MTQMGPDPCLPVGVLGVAVNQVTNMKERSPFLDAFVDLVAVVAVAGDCED